MGGLGGLEEAKQWLRKVLKPFTGTSKDGIPVLLMGGWEQAMGISRGQAVLLRFVGKNIRESFSSGGS